MKKFITFVAAGVMAIGLFSGPVLASGFDEFGYNDQARIFSGPADGVDGVLDGTVYGDPTYQADRLVMKWNAEWDECNDAGNFDDNACLGAWIINQWNGMNPDGSTSNWHYKIIWVGPLAELSPYWVDGGYSIWGNYEVISDQGIDGGEHAVYAKGVPNGLMVH